jgi:hypothetical protein
VVLRHLRQTVPAPRERRARLGFLRHMLRDVRTDGARGTGERSGGVYLPEPSRSRSFAEVAVARFVGDVIERVEDLRRRAREERAAEAFRAVFA